MISLAQQRSVMSPSAKMQIAEIEPLHEVQALGRFKPSKSLPRKIALPAVPKVTPLAGTTWKPRIMFDYNSTLVCFANPKWKGPDEPDASGEYRWIPNFEPQQYMLKAGFEPSYMAYNGTFNRAPWWYNFEKRTWRPVTPALNRYALDPSAYEGNFSDPITMDAVDAMVALAKDADQFWPEIKKYRTIWTDIEGSHIYNPFSYDWVSPTDAVKLVNKWLESATRFRNWPNLAGSMDVFTYGGHLMLYLEYLLQHADKTTVNAFMELENLHGKQYSGFTGCAYNTDMSYINSGDSWFQSVDFQQRILDTYYPGMRENKFMFVMPTWQIYWTDSIRKYHDTKIPIALWKRQIDYLVSRGWNIYLWLGLTWDLAPIKEHLDYLLRFK